MGKTKKPDRFERIVAKVKTKFQCVTSDVQYHLIPDTVVVKLLRQEHRAVMRIAKEPLKYLRSKANLDYQNGYMDAIKSLLDRLTRRAK